MLYEAAYYADVVQLDKLYIDDDDVHIVAKGAAAGGNCWLLGQCCELCNIDRKQLLGIATYHCRRYLEG